MNTVFIDHATYGRLEATWEQKGRMIVVKYGDREKKEVASPNHETNAFTARDVLRAWVAEDMRD